MLTSLHLNKKSREVGIKVRSLPVTLPFNGQVTEQTTVKWSLSKARLMSRKCLQEQARTYLRLSKRLRRPEEIQDVSMLLPLSYISRSFIYLEKNRKAQTNDSTAN